MPSVFFAGWDGVWHAALAALVTYVVVVGLLRAFGATALAKMSAYDLIVTVALGSLVASMALTGDGAVANGTAVVLVFLMLQATVRWVQSRSKLAHHAVRERPRLVVWNGRLLEDRPREHDISADEVRAAVRRAGLPSMAQVQAVVLENDGEWSVIERGAVPDLSALLGLPVPGPDGQDVHIEPDTRPADVGVAESPEDASGDGARPPPQSPV